ncbi:DUF3078 domain-containing protein [Compostibacter hankyongensis]
MKKFFFINALLLLGLYTARAQDQTVQGLKDAAGKTIAIDDTSHKTWRTGGIFSVNIGQGALSNWAAGGDKSTFALNALLNGYASYQKGKHLWDNMADMAYGFLNTNSQGSRKSDDHLYLTSKYGYKAAKKWYYTALVDFKSQFTRGYLYDDAGRTYNSNFLAPAYVLVSLGMDFKPNDNFDLYLSPISSRWTIVSDDTLSAQGKYGVTPGKKVLNEIGAFVSANFHKDLSKTIAYKTRLDLFSNYKRNPQNVDVYWTNLLTMKISKYLATTISLDMIYDDDVKFPGKNGEEPGTAKLQLKEMLGVGFSYKF